MNRCETKCYTRAEFVACKLRATKSNLAQGIPGSSSEMGEEKSCKGLKELRRLATPELRGIDVKAISGQKAPESILPVRRQALRSISLLNLHVISPLQSRPLRSRSLVSQENTIWKRRSQEDFQNHYSELQRVSSAAPMLSEDVLLTGTVIDRPCSFIAICTPILCVSFYAS